MGQDADAGYTQARSMKQKINWRRMTIILLIGALLVYIVTAYPLWWLP